MVIYLDLRKPSGPVANGSNFFLYDALLIRSHATDLLPINLISCKMFFQPFLVAAINLQMLIF